MYRESPYFIENEAYIFDQSIPQYVKEDKSIVEEIQHSMNQMSITPSKYFNRKKPSVDNKQFMSLFNRQQHLYQDENKECIPQPIYCRVCSKECSQPMDTQQICQKPLTFECHCCSYRVCQNCTINCDKCSQLTCKFCSTISYQSCGDYTLCEYCFQ